MQTNHFLLLKKIKKYLKCPALRVASLTQVTPIRPSLSRYHLGLLFQMGGGEGGGGAVRKLYLFEPTLPEKHVDMFGRVTYCRNILFSQFLVFLSCVARICTCILSRVIQQLLWELLSHPWGGLIAA